MDCINDSNALVFNHFNDLLILMRALIIVDIQYDFLPGGALAVRQGDEVIPVINALAPRFELVVATQDWHPRNHGSFAANYPGRIPGEMITLAGQPQVLWPVHCVQGTKGAEISSLLDTSHIKAIFQKGVDPDIDSYSGIFDNGRRRSTGLSEYLAKQGVNEIFIAGLALDYCVKFTALDAVSLGLSTWVIRDACRAVNLGPNDGERAVAQMRSTGVRVVRSKEIANLQYSTAR
jgi:nicotinamidase/pyrazinamidase